MLSKDDDCMQSKNSQYCRVKPIIANTVNRQDEDAAIFGQ